MERIWATSHDGVKVPTTIIYRKDKFNKDGSNPAVIEGYGSYGATLEEFYHSSFISYLDRGIIYVRPHIRGGGYLSLDWYEDGKYLKKENTFLDFIASTEAIIKNKYSSKGKIIARGGSAGGLLVGAVVNMRPDLYKAVVAEVPFVDVMNTMLDETIPLTIEEYKEWGNPNEAEYFKYMEAYSPYDNVKKQPYPNMLITTGFYDYNVPYWEGVKFGIKIREYTTAKNPIYIQVNMGAGHQGAAGKYPAYYEEAVIQQYIIKVLER
ncbi:S9 family peptidase [Flammeovirga pectinis]|uniref:S9 family peptidase n=1 Tax=Flammeovirga pectinis TaxID=2494373 RepID=A0A3S9PB21_9BACT|nr:prolyl oligopeptidase family serine peptidase [Flammeovirga pectinis]AZQ65329.1 S9 family peptidase [Flammeovirga pectinis]